MDAFLTGRKRKLVGWDEILEGGLTKGATVMSWRGVEGGIQACKMGHDVVMAPASHTYLDAYQTKDIKNEPLAIGGFVPLGKTYNFEPVPADFTPDQAAHVLGVQCQLWTEYMKTPSDVEYFAFPRLSAMAEVAWTDPKEKSFQGFVQRLDKHLDRLKVQKINYSNWRAAEHAR